MEALMRVMAAKKREVSALQAGKKEKYLRRAEVETILYEAEKSKQSDRAPLKQQQTNVTTDAQHQQATKKRKLEGEKQQGSGSTGNKDAGSAGEEQQSEDAAFTLPWAEMKKRLRELGEPITLFGESERARIDRLRKAQHDAAFRQEDELEGGHRIRNRFVGHGEQEQQDAENADDAADDAEDFEDSSRIGGGNTTGDQSKEKKKTKAGMDAENDEEEEDESDLDKLVYRFFKGMLQSWEKDLADRPDHVKRTAQGKIATKTMKQCKDYIRPLFKLCKQRQVPSDILPNLVEIVKFCRQGEFVMANDQYIKLAIGNAAWPIGVTMVGIHERTGREKINSNKQAHVMNNEAQRKYLTSVKRLISYAQSISNVLPSKKVVS
ncbi:Pre-mrna-splicing factor 18 [Globisporangium polare]